MGDSKRIEGVSAENDLCQLPPETSGRRILLDYTFMIYF